MSQDCSNDQQALENNTILNSPCNKSSLSPSATSISSTSSFPLSSRKIGPSSGSHLSLSPPPAVPYWYRATDAPKHHPKSFDKSSNVRSNLTSVPPPTSGSHASLLNASTTSEANTSLSNTSQFPTTSSSQPSSSPSTWIQFSASEAARLEAVYQKIQQFREQFMQGDENLSRRRSYPFDTPLNFAPVVSLGQDRLMEVDVEKGIVYPIYWPGPIYEVRRSIWYCLGSGTKWIPCDPSLNRQLEEGYLKIQPWLFRQSSLDSSQSKYDIPEHRHSLFGIYLSKFAVYTSATTAWVMEDSVSAKIQQAVFITLTSGLNLGGQKVIRGYDNLPPVIKDREAKEKELSKMSNKIEGAPVTSEETTGPHQTSSVFPISIDSRTDADKDIPVDHLLLVIHGVGAKLSEHMESVNFISDVGQLRKGMQQALLTKEDPKLRNKNIFVLPIQWRQSIHFAVEAADVEESDDEEGGDCIGQELEEKLSPSQEKRDDELKPLSSPLPGPASYQTSHTSFFSAELNASESHDSIENHTSPHTKNMISVSESNLEKSTQNFPDSHEKVSANLEHKKLPSLDEIMLQGVPTIRTLVTDVVLDVLLFMTPKYKKYILNTVVRELNRVYYLFLSRHPNFQGTVSILGHSLGSVISMEIASEIPFIPLSARPTSTLDALLPHIDKWYPKASSCINSSTPSSHLSLLLNHSTDHLTFEVEHLFCMGSPLGYFLLLQGQRLRPRRNLQELSTSTTKRPRVKYLYNLFSQYDPVAVRMEPLISRALVSMTPYSLPYQKGGLKALQQGVENVTNRAMDALRLSSGYFTSIFRPLTQTMVVDKSISASETKVDEEDIFNGIRLLNPRYGRVDFALQQGLLENPYLAALSIHMSYWSDLDIAYFLSGEIASEPSVASSTPRPRA